MPAGVRWLSAAGFALLASCGYVGDPLPPALNIPAPVSDLRVVQRGDRLVIECSLPRLTTDGLMLRKLGEIDLRVGPAEAAAEGVSAWAGAASRIEAAGGGEDGRLHVEAPAGGYVGQEVAVGVRVSGPKGRWSDWSNLAGLQVVRPVKRPSGLRAEAAPEGVRVSWRAEDGREGVRYRVRRRTAESETSEEAAEVVETEWVDTATEYGRRYEYRVQAVVSAGAGLAESDWAAAVVTPEDRFPPAPPEGLRAVAGLATAELSWDSGREPDLAYYRVYRSEGEGGRRRIADRVEEPNYSDGEVSPGRRYTYTVTAVDRLGNESPASAPAEVAMPRSGDASNDEVCSLQLEP